jgi:hypothetical protein
MYEKNPSFNPRLKKLLDFKQLGPDWNNQLELFAESQTKYKRVMACRHKTGKLKLQFLQSQFTDQRRHSPDLSV